MNYCLHQKSLFTSHIERIGIGVVVVVAEVETTESPPSLVCALWRSPCMASATFCPACNGIDAVVVVAAERRNVHSASLIAHLGRFVCISIIDTREGGVGVEWRKASSMALCIPSRSVLATWSRLHRACASSRARVENNGVGNSIIRSLCSPFNPPFGAAAGHCAGREGLSIPTTVTPSFPFVHSRPSFNCQQDGQVPNDDNLHGPPKRKKKEEKDQLSAGLCTLALKKEGNGTCNLCPFAARHSSQSLEGLHCKFRNSFTPKGGLSQV